MPFQSVRFEDETDIRYEFQLETSAGQDRIRRVLVAKFAGHYRPGHRGAPDAGFIQGMTQAGLIVWQPAALVLDLRELSYTWGDDMEEVLGARGEIRVPFAIVGSELCLGAIGTLIQQFHAPGSIKSATDAESIFDNLEEALEYVYEGVTNRRNVNEELSDPLLSLKEVLPAWRKAA
jgi:hypothetical protein